LPQAKFALEETDFEGMSLLLHAAGSGSAPIFQIVFRAMESTFPAEDGVRFAAAGPARSSLSLPNMFHAFSA